MTVCDAWVSETRAPSFVELSLSPYFDRRGPSLYEAFQDGRRDRAEFRRVIAASAPPPPEGKRGVLGIDARSIARPASPTARDRSSQYVHNLPSCAAPVTPGGSFSAVVVLPEEPPSWTSVLDNQRIETKQTPTEVAQEQLRALVPLLPSSPLGLGDRGYGNAAFVQATQDIPCDGLLRISQDRVFYRAAPPVTGKRGAPRKDGSRFKGSDPSTHGAPEVDGEGVDSRGGRGEVARGNTLPFKQCRDPTVSLFRILRHGAPDSKRDPKVSGFVWVKRTEAPEPLLSEIPSL